MSRLLRASDKPRRPFESKYIGGLSDARSQRDDVRVRIPVQHERFRGLLWRAFDYIVRALSGYVHAALSSSSLFYALRFLGLMLLIDPFGFLESPNALTPLLLSPFSIHNVHLFLTRRSSNLPATFTRESQAATASGH